jgi:hypothetical protein
VLAADGLTDFISDLLSCSGTGFLRLGTFARNYFHETQQLFQLKFIDVHPAVRDEESIIPYNPTSNTTVYQVQWNLGSRT